MNDFTMMSRCPVKLLPKPQLPCTMPDMISGDMMSAPKNVDHSNTMSTLLPFTDSFLKMS